jgi:hypothetical protein
MSKNPPPTRQQPSKPANTLRISAYVGSSQVASTTLPAADPAGLYQSIGQYLAAVHHAGVTGKQLAVAVMPRWKLWILRNILRVR